jgi:S-adenosylmethionine-diacylglycerol 3-amino-3-carboxypropyl transferase
MMWLPGNSPTAADEWVKSTATLPVAFAQVREDPQIDAALVRHVDRPPRILMIASGGETAAWLSTLQVKSLHLVDINRAQLDLTRFKLDLLTTAERDERLQLLGYQPISQSARSHEISLRLARLDLPPDALGPRQWIAQFGPDQCGRYEWLFARLRDLLRDQSEALIRLMHLRDPAEQSACVAPGSELGDDIQAAFNETMDLNCLIEIFGHGATANRRESFADHFMNQSRRALATFPAADNPFLQQIFLGRFLGAAWPWLEAPQQDRLPTTQYSCDRMGAVLAAAADESYDFIHLSNILDWIQPAEAASVLQYTFRCLSPGGIAVIRQLNSRLEVREIPCALKWLEQTAADLHRSDQSFFYRTLHVGMKP